MDPKLLNLYFIAFSLHTAKLQNQNLRFIYSVNLNILHDYLNKQQLFPLQLLRIDNMIQAHYVMYEVEIDFL